jgi:hypothetical protein
MLLLLMTGNAGAMFSDNYRLDWFTPMTGGGGGPTGSTNYAVNLTVGQAVIGACSSDNNGASLGYWSGAGTPNHIYLPLLLRH